MDSVKRDLKSRIDELVARMDARMDKLVSNQDRVQDTLSVITAAVRDLAASKATDAHSGSRGDAHVRAMDVGEERPLAKSV
jgi:hypothetical protein